MSSAASWREHIPRSVVAGKCPARRLGGNPRSVVAGNVQRGVVAGTYPARRRGGNPRSVVAGTRSRAKQRKKAGRTQNFQPKLGSFAPVRGWNRCKRLFCTGSSHEPVQKAQILTVFFPSTLLFFAVSATTPGGSRHDAARDIFPPRRRAGYFAATTRSAEISRLHALYK
jgi:hypothetical protein